MVRGRGRGRGGGERERERERERGTERKREKNDHDFQTAMLCQLSFIHYIHVWAGTTVHVQPDITSTLPGTQAGVGTQLLSVLQIN